MAIAHLNSAIVGRSAGKSSVHAAAYASRTDLVDERTGIAYRYARKSGDVVASFVWLPKGAPDQLRDRAALWNAVEKIETRKNSQLARRIILALPHELTPQQREYLLKDFVRENFTRKGLAADVNVHKPDPKGDERNYHAHILIPTRFIGKDGIGEKDRVNKRGDLTKALEELRADWEKRVNHQLERHGHADRISMKSLEAQGIDRTPQIHLGQGASALDRKGVETDRAAELRAIVANQNAAPLSPGRDFTVAAALAPQSETRPQTILEALPLEQAEPVNDNDPSGEVANDNERADGKEVTPEDAVDRDADAAAWQDRVDAAGIAHAEAQRQAFLATQLAARETVERHGREMAERHAAAWHEVMDRHQGVLAGYQEGTVEEAAEAMTTGFAFILGWLASIAESMTGTPHRPRRSQTEHRKEQARQAQQAKEAQARELEAVMQEQAREREQHERRRALMLHQQAAALAYFEAQLVDRSSMQTEFRAQTDYEQSRRDGAGSWEKQRIMPKETGKDKGSQRDGPELDR